MTRLGAHAALLGAAAIWGGGFIAQADAMRGLGPLWFTTLRYGLAALTLLPMLAVERRSAQVTLKRTDLAWLLAMGAAFTVASLLQQFAVTHTSVTHVGFLTGLYVLFVPMLGAAMLRQVPRPLVFLAALLALAGTWLIGGGLDGLNGGDLLAIGCALGFAAQILLLDRIIAQTRRPVLAVAFQSAFCTACTLPVALGTETISLAALPSVLPALLFAGIFSGGLAFLLQAIGQSATAPSVAAILLMSESLFAAVFAVALLGERLTGLAWLGCGLLFASLLLAQIAPARAAPRDTRSTRSDQAA